MMENKLLAPCPFCGKQEDVNDEWFLSEITDDGFVLNHGCTAAESPSNVTFYGRTRQDCIDAWNTRTTPTPEALSCEHIAVADANGAVLAVISNVDDKHICYGEVQLIQDAVFYEMPHEGGVMIYAKPAKDGEG